jgi:hypothetical protein
VRAGKLLPVTVLIATLGVVDAFGVAPEAETALAAVSAAPANSDATTAAKKPKCERRVYRRAKVCRDGRYRRGLLWHPKRNRKAAARRGRVPCVPQHYLSGGVKAKADLLFGGPVCVERKVFGSWSVSQLEGIWLVGLSRCMIMNASPGGGFGSLLSLANSSRFCSAEYEGDARGYRGWGYVLLG